MRIDSQRKLFVGIRLDNKARDQLERCPQRDRVFFEDPEGRYLTVLRDEETSYLGKIIDAGTPASTMDDIRRNVVSILNRVCPGRRDEDEIKVLSVAETEPPPVVRPGPSEDPEERSHPADRNRRGYW